MEEISRLGLPNLAGTIIAARDELIAVLIEPTVSEREYVRLEGLKQFKILLFFLFYLKYQFCV